jgi:1-acyl-sn-glycerol-3-phosphate acyltransferase
MNKLKLSVFLCYSIPVLFLNFPIGLILSYLLKIARFDEASNRINNYLAYFWLRSFLFLTGRTLEFQAGDWNPMSQNRFLICNHTNALEVPLIVSLPYLSGAKNIKLSYLGGDIIQRYKIVPLMMHSKIVEAVIYSEQKPNFRDFKTKVLNVIKTRSIFLYPEGKRTFTEEIQPFETGVMKIAYKYKVDLDVFVVSGMMGYSDLPEYAHLKKSKNIYFVFCGTVKAQDFTDFDSFLNKAMNLMKTKKRALETKAMI